MSRCAQCGNPTLGDDLCPYHTADRSDRATGNRIMCDIHRGLVWERLPEGAALPEEGRDLPESALVN